MTPPPAPAPSDTDALDDPTAHADRPTLVWRYNLLDEPWIPVFDEHGNEREVGLLGLFANADTFTGLAEPDPLTESALLRTLLAVLQAAVPEVIGPGQWASRIARTGFPTEQVLTYLESRRDEFDVFNESRPAFQDPHVRQIIKTGSPDLVKTPTHLHPMLYADQAVAHFDKHHAVTMPHMPVGLAVRLLLTKQVWSNGQNSDFGGSCQDSPVWRGSLVLPHGRTLARTLALMFYPCDPALLGVPVWDVDMSPAPARVKKNTSKEDESSKEKKKKDDRNHEFVALPSGWLGRLTWPTRNALLIPGPDPDNPTRPVVVGCVLGFRGQSWKNANAFIPGLVDPSYLYFETPDDDTVKHERVTLNAQRAVWRDLYPHLAYQQTVQSAGGSLTAASRGCRQISLALDWAEQWASLLPHDWDDTIQVGVYGIDRTDQGRPGTMPTDRFTVSGQLARANGTGTVLADALAQAEKIAADLTSKVVEAYKKSATAGGAKAGQKAASNNAARDLWWALGTAFRPLAAAAVTAPNLADPALTAAAERWRTVLRDNTLTAFETWTRAVPTSPRGFNARAQARKKLTATLTKLGAL